MNDQHVTERGCEDWTHDEIRDYYDTTNVTILTLAGMLGMTGSEVKEILMQKKD
jgi:hypothetical protein